MASWPTVPPNIYQNSEQLENTSPTLNVDKPSATLDP